MAFAWDRFLETCYRRDASVALLVAGTPPMIRTGDLWRTLDLPQLTADGVVALAAERVGPSAQGSSQGYAFSDFWFGDVAFFRVMAFGYPETHLIVVSRSTPSRPPPADPRFPDGAG